MSLHVLYLGNFTPDHSTETHVARSLESLGHKVTRLQENQNGVLRIIRRAIHRGGIDLLLHTRTWPLPMGEYVSLMDYAESHEVVTAAYHLDRFVGLPRESEIIQSPMFKAKFVFTADGAPATEKFYADHGVNHHWLPAGVMDDECELGTYRHRFAGKVAFVGSRGYHPEWRHRPQLVDFLAQTYGEAFVKAGDGNPASCPYQLKGNERVRGNDLNDLYASVDLAVGDSLLLYGKDDRYWSDRVYETIGRGALLIHPQVDALDEEFNGLLPAWPLGDFDALRETVDWWLTHPIARSDRLDDLRHIVAERCTYEARMQTLLETVGLA